jgi:PilZ domain
MDQERRRTPRYGFVAGAEVVEETSGAKLKTRLSEFSVNGCYLDLTNPLPKGTKVTVKIFTEKEFFEAPGIVVYTHPNLGMGVEFHDIKPFFQAVLKKWLLAAMVGKTE